MELRWSSGRPAKVELQNFCLKHGREEPMIEDRLALTELLEKAGEGDFLRAVAEAVLQLLMEADQAPGERSEFCRKPAI